MAPVLIHILLGFSPNKSHPAIFRGSTYGNTLSIKWDVRFLLGFSIPNHPAIGVPWNPPDGTRVETSLSQVAPGSVLPSGLSPGLRGVESQHEPEQYVIRHFLLGHEGTQLWQRNWQERCHESFIMPCSYKPLRSHVLLIPHSINEGKYSSQFYNPAIEPAEHN